MAIAQMSKIMIVTHRSEAVDVLEALQQEGIAQILDAERTMISKDWPELQVEVRRPRDLEDMVSRFGKATAFLKDYAEEDPSVSIFSPLVSIDKKKYLSSHMIQKDSLKQYDNHHLHYTREHILFLKAD